MDNDSKIGIVYFTSEWFRDVGIQDDSSKINIEVQNIADTITSYLSKKIDIVPRGVVYTVKDAKRVGDDLYKENIKALIIAPLMWCEDNLVRAVLGNFNKSILLLLISFIPNETLDKNLTYHQMIKGSGTVAALQISGMLKREGYKYYNLIGYYEQTSLYDNIYVIYKSIEIKEILNKSKCGILPYRCDQMSVTYVDEFKIRELYGIEFEYIELNEVKSIAESINDEEINKFLNDIKSLEIIIKVDEKNLIHGIKYSIALEKLAKAKNLQVLAINDIIDEMHKNFGIRPSLTNINIINLPTLISMEADIAAGITMYILFLFTGYSPFYTEVFNIDIKNNAFLMGHAGYHDIRHANKKYPIEIIPDVEYVNSDSFTGACIYFRYQEGPVTAINGIYDGDRLKWTIFEGYSISNSIKLVGNSYIYCRLKKDVKDIFNKAVQAGVSQHWIIIPGHYKDNLKILSDVLNIEYNPL